MAGHDQGHGDERCNRESSAVHLLPPMFGPL
jgi:hypothetical protein